MLRAELGGNIPIRTTDEAGLRSETKEALAFAFLGYLTVHGLPGTLPSCTGARSAEVLGSITPGASWPLNLDRIPAPSSIRLL